MPCPYNSHLIERVIEISDQIFHVLDADRNADESVSDADAFADFRGDRGMSHRRGMRDQSLDAAQAFCKRAELYMVEHFPGILECDHVEGDHGAEAALLPDRNVVVRMRRQAGVVDELHAGMVFEEARD